ncbi:protein ANTI-SILENCING 1 [Artemisia annua]|uniref:Protein ANTI-SILENCING 1 n=1 Tax=Artemisia annua TaxID=35608 RepID=A0A2U1P9L5_ARTAN|nr:protein ANTI-SILENCING 1 [Artemisia annua]
MSMKCEGGLISFRISLAAYRLEAELSIEVSLFSDISRDINRTFNCVLRFRIACIHINFNFVECCILYMENIDEDLEFKWLKKKGVGGKNKEVQFYESFIYDGVKYALYDCVYMYKEGLQEPYIAKLTKIWERKGNIKKVKVHWFFRPEEISKWLGNTKTLENEILFASGEGHGLTNINSLESIAGACNVVCVSKDCRNPQPSAEELKAADFVFYRTFDVQSCTISDKMDDKVGDLEIKYVFNQKEGEIPESIPKTKEDNATSSEPQQLPTTIVPNKLDDDPNQLKRNITPTESDKLNDRPLKKLKAGGKNPPEEKHAETEVAQESEKLTGMPSKKSKVDNTNKIQVDVNKLKGVETSGTKSETGKTDKANKDDMKVSIGPVDNKVDNKERNKTPTGSDRLPNQPLKKQKSDVKNPPMVDNKSKHEEKLPADVRKLKGAETLGTNSETGKTDKANKDDMKVSLVPLNNKVDNKEGNKTPTGSGRLPNQPLKKQKSDVKNPPMVDNKSKHEEKLPADVNNLKALGTSGVTEEKLNQKNGKVSSKVTDDSEGKVIKKSKDDGSAKLPDNKKLGNSGSGKDLVANSSSPKGKSKSGLPLNSTANNKESKEEQSSENKRKLTMNKSFKLPASLTDKDKKSAYQEFVCGPKPNDDKSSWFRQLPWDERLKTAYDQGTAILLHNVDPDYTSAEIEDIIWHAFNESCGAKIVQRTAVSSPHYAQAIILLKTKEAAQKILVKLDEECLMLSNGRPLVATNCPPMSKKKNSSFFGHLKIKVQNQRDVDEAVSTSHFSQPNTIEYDMAMDWCLLQNRSKKWWDKLHKLQGLELKNLESNRVQK